VAGCWRRMRTEELHNSYASPDTVKLTSRRMRWVGHQARTEKMRITYKVLVGKLEEKRARRIYA